MLLWHGSTPGVYIEGNANVAATGDYVGRHILILSVYLARDIHFLLILLASARPSILDEQPIILAHWRDLQRYTYTRPQVYEP